MGILAQVFEINIFPSICCTFFQFEEQLQGISIKVLHGVPHRSSPRGDPYGGQNVSQC